MYSWCIADLAECLGDPEFDACTNFPEFCDDSSSSQTIFYGEYPASSYREETYDSAGTRKILSCSVYATMSLWEIEQLAYAVESNLGDGTTG